MPTDSLVFKCAINGSLLKLGIDDLGLNCSVRDTRGTDIGTFGVRLASENGKRNIEVSVSKDLVSGLIGAIDIGKLLEKVDLGKLIGTSGLF